MKSYKSKSNYPLSLRSMFFSKKESILLRNQKQLLISIVKIFKMFLEFVLCKWKIFSFSIKKSYLSQLITFNERTNFLSKNLSGGYRIIDGGIIYGLEKLKNSRSTIMLFFNLPFILSKILFEIFESIQKKTVYLYRIILLLSVPLIFFCVNNTFVLQEKKDVLSFILPEKKHFISYGKNFPFFNYLKHEMLHDQIVPFFSKKIKSYDPQSQMDYLFWDKILSPFFSLKNSNLRKKKNLYKKINLSKWLDTYIYLKKKYSSNFQNDWIYLTETSNHLGIAKSNYLLPKESPPVFQLFQLSKNTFIKVNNNSYLHNINSFLRKDIFHKIDNFLFSLIKPRYFSYLNKGAEVPLLLNKPLFLKNFFNQREIKKNFHILQSTNKEHWLIPISQWIDLCNPQDNYSLISKKKQTLKDKLSLFKNVNGPEGALYKIFLQNVCIKPLLNSTNLPFTFIKSKKVAVFRSYQNSLILNNCPLRSRREDYEKEIFLIEKQMNFEYFPLSRKIAKRFLGPFPSTRCQKRNFLYNFSLFFPLTGTYSSENLFLNPELLFRLQNKVKEPTCAILENRNIYDLDFYLTNYKPKDDLFWISNLRLQKPVSNQKETKLDYLNKKTIASTANNFSIFTSFHEDFYFLEKKRETFQNIIRKKKSDLLTKYNKWFFTPQWWLFQNNGLVNDIQYFLEKLNTRRQIFLYRLSKKFFDFSLRRWSHREDPKGQKKDILTSTIKIVPYKVFSQVQWWNKFIAERIYTSTPEKPLWIKLQFLPSGNNSFCNFFSWFFISSLVYYHWLPMLTGVIYLYLWLDFEKLRSLSYPSWKMFINILAQNNFDSPSHQLRLTEYSSRGKILSIYSFLYTKFIGNFFILNRFHYTTTLDLSRKNKNLVSNSLITTKTLKSKYDFWNINQKNENKTINGFNFFQKWCEKNYRISGFVQKNVLKSYSFTWLTDLFFYNRFLISNVQGCFNLAQSFNKKSKPNPLVEPSICTKRWLFIGSSESGKSFAIKSIAASTYYPLIRISIKDIKTLTPDNKYNKVKKQTRWIEQLSERSFFLENILNLAKILAPSMLWISDLHDFYTKYQIQEKNPNKVDPSVLMATLLKILTIDLVPNGQNHIIFVGSTDHPRLLDPKFLSRHRLDFIVNFRKPSISQRQSIFTFFLKNKGFALKGVRSFYEFSCNTLGYTFQDILSLVNETLLVKTSENNTFIDSNTVRLALYRKTSIQSVKYITGRQENLQYKIGKALVQSILVYPKSLLLLSKYNDLWKTKFYFLSNSYLEVSNKKTLITEISMLTQVFNCMAGSAARDAWLLAFVQEPKNKENFPEVPSREKITVALTSQLKYDFSIASNIIQSLLTEFPMQNINSITPISSLRCWSRSPQDPVREKDPTDQQPLRDEETCEKKPRKNLRLNFQFIKKSSPYLKFFDQFPSYIDWSIKAKRLSFSWLLLFSGIEHSIKNIGKLVDKNKESTSPSIFEKEIDINLPYERKETKREQQKIQKIESLFNKMLYTISMHNLGFPWESEYVMDYNPLQFSLFFMESRILWNPQTLLPAYSILFFDRDLLINQKLLTNLYITYGNKFQNEKLNRKRIKKQYFWSSFTFSKLNLNQKLETKNDYGDYRIQDFYFFRNLMNLNAQLDQSQIQVPVYLHQSWITPDHNETFRAFDFLYTKMLVKNNDLIYKESLIFENLLEIYHYLVKFFIKNKSIMNQLNGLLMKNKILYREDIEMFIKKKL